MLLTQEIKSIILTVCMLVLAFLEVRQIRKEKFMKHFSSNVFSFYISVFGFYRYPLVNYEVNPVICLIYIVSELFYMFFVTYLLLKAIKFELKSISHLIGIVFSFIAFGLLLYFKQEDILYKAIIKHFMFIIAFPVFCAYCVFGALHTALLENYTKGATLFFSLIMSLIFSFLDMALIADASWNWLFYLLLSAVFFLFFLFRTFFPNQKLLFTVLIAKVIISMSIIMMGIPLG